MGEKRYVNPRMWNDRWYRGLTPLYKCIWKFICDTCEDNGIFQVDLAHMSFMIKGSDHRSEFPSEEEILQVINHKKERLKVLDDEHWWVVDYLDFQWNCKALHISTNTFHAKMKAAFDRYGINYPVVQSVDANHKPDPEREKTQTDSPKPIRFIPSKIIFVDGEDDIELWKEEFPTLDIESCLKGAAKWLHNYESSDVFQKAVADEPTKPAVWRGFVYKWLRTELQKQQNPKKPAGRPKKEKEDSPPLQEQAKHPFDKASREVDEANKAYEEFMKKKGKSDGKAGTNK